VDPNVALARLLERADAVDGRALARCLREVQAGPRREPDALARLLVARGLADRAAVEAALRRLSEGGSTLRRSDPLESRERTLAGPPPALARAPRQVGPYRVRRELGRGAFGAVLEVEHAETGARYALKVLLRGIERLEAEDLARFRREGEVLRSLDHPAICRVVDLQVDREPRYLVQELLPGGSLKERLRARGSLRPREAARLVATLADALDHAHAQGVLHRDLKPDNVLFDAEGRPRLVDFGLARAATGGQSLTATGQVLGTPVYMAPEQALGQKERVGARTDVYGLGGLLYAALAGVPPVQGASLTDVLAAVQHDAPPPIARYRDDAPPELEAVCRRALAKDPADRHASAAELAAELRRWLGPEGRPAGGGSAGARRGRVAPRATRRSDRAPSAAAGGGRRWLAIGAAAALVALAAGLALAVALASGEGGAGADAAASATSPTASTAEDEPDAEGEPDAGGEPGAGGDPVGEPSPAASALLAPLAGRTLRFFQAASPAPERATRAALVLALGEPEADGALAARVARVRLQLRRGSQLHRYDTATYAERLRLPGAVLGGEVRIRPGPEGVAVAGLDAVGAALAGAEVRGEPPAFAAARAEAVGLLVNDALLADALAARLAWAEFEAPGGVLTTHTVDRGGATVRQGLADVELVRVPEAEGTLTALAEAVGSTPGALALFNDLDSPDVVSAGQVFEVPRFELPATLPDRVRPLESASVYDLPGAMLLGRLDRGVVVARTGAAGGWSRVSYRGGEAWVADAALEPEAGPLARVTGGVAGNVGVRPAPDGSIAWKDWLGYLHPGQLVAAEGAARDGFRRVGYGPGYGWVRTDNLEPTE